MNPIENEKDYCTLYLVRHGETEFNANRITMGQGDSPLTERGKSQALSLAEKFKDISFDAVFSSDLFRTQHTAEIILAEKKLAIQTSKHLRERSYGSYEGKPVDEYLQVFLKTLNELKDESETQRLKFKVGVGDESDEEVLRRLVPFLRETAIAYPGKKVLVVTHGGCMRLFLTKIGFGTREELLGAVKNTAYVKLLSDGVDFFVRETAGIEKNHPDYNG